MIFSIPKGFTQVKEGMFRWFVKTLHGSVAKGANGTGYYDQHGTLVALEVNGSYYVKP